MATNQQVWCLVINHKNKPIGKSFSLVLGGDIAELREKVKEKAPDEVNGVSAHQLTVLRCVGRNSIFDDQDPTKLESQVREAFANVEPLSSRQTIQDLGDLTGETLLVKLPFVAVWYLVIDHENKPIGMPSKLVLGGDIAELREKVKEKKSIALPADELTVWQCKERKLFADKGNKELEELINTINFDEANALTSATTVMSLDLDENEILLVRMPAPSAGTRKRGAEVEDRVAKRLRFSEAQVLDVQAARNALPPSSAAAMPAFRNEQEKRPILNGRPHHNSGPPVGLFHPVFNSFHAAMKNPERHYADAETYSSVRALFQAFAYIYESEAKRVEAIDKHLGTLFGSDFSTLQAPGVKSDGVINQYCGRSIVYVVIREIKNEIGTAGADPYNQGSLAYRKYWAGEAQDVIRRYSHCPSIILAIAGPWLCVSGGVYLQQAVTQPLTDYIWLGGDDYNEDRLLFATRLFAALKSAISTLRLYYDDLASRLSNPNSQNPISDAFPFVTEYGSTKFTYLSRLAPEYPNKLLYKAKLNNEHRMIVVKFVSRYHAEAHRILAGHHLAPTLHYAGTDDAEASMYGGRCMIVMDFVEGKPMMDFIEGKSVVYSLSERQFNQVNRAVKLLHSKDIVFGDLRQPNILITGEDVMIIDFDWCGRAGEARYPASLNPDAELGWHEDVEPDSVMMKDHDLFMLKKLTIAG